MPEPTPARLAGLAAGLVLLVLLTLLRGPVVLLAAGFLVLAAVAGLRLLPLLGRDPVDWDWFPDRADDLAPEPGVARLRRLVDPPATDTAASRQLQELVRAVATDRLGDAPPGDGPLARYLSAPPRRLAVDELEAVLDDLEAATRPPKETP